MLLSANIHLSSTHTFNPLLQQAIQIDNLTVKLGQSILIVMLALLASIAMFSMCSLEIPPQILEHMEKIRKQCLWDKKQNKGSKKITWLLGTEFVCLKRKGNLL